MERIQHHARRVAFAALPLLACTDRPPGCDCIPESTPTSWSPPPGPTCGEPLCPTVSVVESEDVEGGFVVNNPDALDCALSALRDRSPGVLRWAWSDGFGQYTEDGYILINTDGTAVRRDYGAADLSYEVSDAELGTLPVVGQYELCLLQPDPRVRFSCFRNTALAKPEVCDQGWYDELD